MARLDDEATNGPRIAPEQAAPSVPMPDGAGPVPPAGGYPPAGFPPAGYVPPAGGWAMPPGTPPLRRSRKGLWLTLATLAGVIVLAAGAIAVMVVAHNAEKARQDAQAEQLAAKAATALGEWNGELAAIAVPEAGDIMDSVWTDGSTKEREAVAAGCAKYADYGMKLAALPEPPEPKHVAPDVAERVPAYQAAARTAAQQRASFDAARTAVAADLKELDTFCTFYDHEWQVRHDMRVAQKAWEKKMWKKGTQETRGSWVYSCPRADGCLPPQPDWPSIVPTYRKAFVAPSHAEAKLFRSSCPFADKSKECELVAGAWENLAKDQEKFAKALKAKNSAQVGALNKNATTYERFAKGLAGELNDATSDGYDDSGKSDPSFEMVYRGLQDVLASFKADHPDAAASGSIAS